MQSKNLVYSYPNETVAELFDLRINPIGIKKFIKKGDEVHRFFSSLKGYDGMDILFLSEENIIILIRWQDYKLFDENLSKILNTCLISDWFKNVVSISHQPVILNSLKG